MLQSRRHVLGQLAGTAVALPAFAQTGRAPLSPTPNEVTGPFYPLVKPADTDVDMTRVAGRTSRAEGEVIELSGRVVDLAGRPVSGARLEIWQANAAGRYAHASDPNPAPLDPDFQGYALLSSDAGGGYRFVTIRPGPYPGGRRGMRTRHIHFEVLGRVDRLVAQMYFPGEPLNATDQLLQASVDPQASIARAIGPDAAGIARYNWDIVLRTG